MTTLWRIVANELLEARRSRTLVALGVVLALLLAGAAVVGAARHDAVRHQRERYQSMVASQFRDQPDRHPHRVSHYGFLVFRPPAALGFFDLGVESQTGTSIFLEGHRQNAATFSDASQDDGLRRFGELTMAIVVQAFVPLLVLAVGAVTITREREARTLPLILCQGVSWTTLLWGKVMGTLVVSSLIVLPGTLVVGAWLALSGTAVAAHDVGARAALLVALHLAFLAACATIGVGLSAVHRTSRGALLTAMGVWMALWVVVPRTVPGLAVAVHPLPSRASFDAQVERRVRELGDSHNPGDPRFTALRERLLRDHGVARVEDLPVNYNGVVMTEGERITSEAYAANAAALLDTQRRQSRIVEWAGFVSPFVAMRTLSMALAGSDMAHAAEFERQAESYRYDLIQRLNALHTTEVPHARDRYLGAGADNVPSRQRISADHWDELPLFAYEPTTARWALDRQRFGLASLAWWCLVALGVMAGLGRMRSLEVA